MLKSALAGVVTILLAAPTLSALPIRPGLFSGVLKFVTRVLSATAGPLPPLHRLIGAVEQLVGTIVSLVSEAISGFGPRRPPTPSAFPRHAFGTIVPVAVLLDISGELEAALAFPSWTGTVVKYAGLCTLLLGVMAWLSSTGYPRRLWGRRIAVSGAGLTIVGFAFDTFINVVKYVLAG